MQDSPSLTRHGDPPGSSSRYDESLQLPTGKINLPPFFPLEDWLAAESEIVSEREGLRDYPA